MDAKFSFTGLVSWKLLVAALVLALVSAMAVGLGASLSVRAAPGAGYILERGQVSAGGGAASSVGYQLSGAVAQPEGGALSGGDYSLQGGFWQQSTYTSHLPLVVR